MKNKLRITASRVPGLLGKNPWQSISQAMQETIASAAGLKWEVSNEVFEYGKKSEPKALVDLEEILGNDDGDAQINHTGKNQKWLECEVDEMTLGCYPDGIAFFNGKRFLVEIKCPYSRQLKKLAETHYEDQLYFQLFVARKYYPNSQSPAGFIYFCWGNTGEEEIEMWEISDKDLNIWWNKNKSTFKKYWLEMQEVLNDKEKILRYCQSFHKVQKINDDVNEFIRVDIALKELIKQKKFFGEKLWGAEKNIAFYDGKEIILATNYQPTRAVDRKKIDDDMYLALSFLPPNTPPELLERFKTGTSAYENLSWRRGIKIPKGKMTKKEALEHTLDFIKK